MSTCKKFLIWPKSPVFFFISFDMIFVFVLILLRKVSMSPQTTKLFLTAFSLYLLPLHTLSLSFLLVLSLSTTCQNDSPFSLSGREAVNDLFKEKTLRLQDPTTSSTTTSLSFLPIWSLFRDICQSLFVAFSVEKWQSLESLPHQQKIAFPVSQYAVSAFSRCLHISLKSFSVFAYILPYIFPPPSLFYWQSLWQT